ncbi:ribosome biogenesis GTP-binding protein YihA/YsxC [Thermodesulfatator autotrophicus]|uniref:Probable GTP-binding protein EngB n=1 Tax=Thermodesulfatator autotrophicus TaxID=1795632 RepID=A0A177E536_9BACT|nr:ribosome biogenesis GTP-binding protein YihA/YsxC [Thermodesulfatator autotrophicus]OAG27064.1 ribosome biogenesis GTP-binding protein [Thermodesulfatator autotrophicus]
MKPRIKQVKFEKSAFKPEDLPVPKLPEVAFLGRSNVGKSSLINAFLGQKRLARVSSTPGFTKAINFYRVDHKFWVVDLPGFGFAKVSPKMRAQWKKLIETYLSSPRLIKLLVLIFDIRREPDELDFMLIDYVKGLGRNFIIVLNKTDRAKKTELPKLKKRYLDKLSLEEEKVFLCSCKTKEGLEPIKQKIWENIG